MADDDRPDFPEATRQWLVARHPTDTVARVFADALDAGSSMTRAEIEAAVDGESEVETLEQFIEIYGPRFFLDVSGAVIGETFEEYLARTQLS